VAILGGVLLVRGRDRYTPLALLWGVVYLVEGHLAVGRIIWNHLGEHLGYGRRKGCLAVVDVAYGAHV
jgi:hypothetical protein